MLSLVVVGNVGNLTSFFEGGNVCFAEGSDVGTLNGGRVVVKVDGRNKGIANRVGRIDLVKVDVELGKIVGAPDELVVGDVEG